ncbi:TonB family protein [Falsirhodobacter sp. 1013]|uniref:TonB family protein n=1 Tax=Falsirhodobacter sp. 1013 TaxID=3417566 RepID=UPI003EBCD151
MNANGADWLSQMTRAEQRRERLGWVGAAAAVAVAVAATTAIAMHSDREGQRDEDAILINLEPPAAAPPAQAVSAPAPEVPQTEAPEAPELIEEAAPPPEPLAEDIPLPEPEPLEELPPPKPDEIALPDAPPPPPPKVRPVERPERPERVVREEPKRERAAPPPQNAAPAAPSRTQGQAQRQISAGAAQDLRRQWGAQISSRIERRLRGGRGKGIATLQLTVTSSGQLLGVSLLSSSGDPALDQRIMQATRSAASSFPSAPAGLTESRYSFEIPMGLK